MEIADLRRLNDGQLMSLAENIRRVQVERAQSSRPEIMGGQRIPAAAAAIIRIAAAEGGLTIDELMGLGREMRITHPRQRAMASIDALERPDGTPRYSRTEIGAMFGRDRTTVNDQVQRAMERGDALIGCGQ